MENTIIIENGVQDEFTPNETKKLIEAGLIYRCPECDSTIAHLSVDATWSEIDRTIGREGN